MLDYIGVGHSLRGLCGLKFQVHVPHESPDLSQPARAVWIEIMTWPNASTKVLSQPARAVWIEIAAGK